MKSLLQIHLSGVILLLIMLFTASMPKIIFNESACSTYIFDQYIGSNKWNFVAVKKKKGLNNKFITHDGQTCDEPHEALFSDHTLQGFTLTY